MWIARDRDGSLGLYEKEPVKNIERGCWHCYQIAALDPALFPEVRWEDDEPTEVEAKIEIDLK